METETNKQILGAKLAEISLVMSDGYYFLKMRELLGSWQDASDLGDEDAKAAMLMVTRFHKLCSIVKNG